MKNITVTLEFLALAALLLFLAGCQTVPSDTFSITPSTGAVTVDSPKDWHAHLLEATLKGGNHIRIEDLSATNAPAVIAAVGAANAQMAAQIAEMLKTLQAILATQAMRAGYFSPVIDARSWPTNR